MEWLVPLNETKVYEWVERGLRSVHTQRELVSNDQEDE